MRIRLILVVICGVLLTNCQDETDPRFLLKEGTSKKNLESLAFAKALIDTAATIDRANGFKAGAVAAAPEYVNITEKVALVFKPQNFDCPLPDKIRKKMQDEKNWVPDIVATRLKDLPEKALFLDHQSVNYLLNTFEIKNGTKNYKATAKNTPSFVNLYTEKYIDKNQDNFTFSIDCSGYLNASLAGGASAPIGEIKTQAKALLDSKKSLLIAQAYVFSPLLVALRPEKFPKIKLSPYERLEILTGFLTAVAEDANATDTIVASTQYNVIWTSYSGANGFNGEGSLTGNVGATAGFASIQVSSSAGGSMSRTSSFSSFDTYLISSDEVPASYGIITVADLRKEIERLTSRAIIVNQIAYNNRVEIEILLPDILCGLDWKVKGKDFLVTTKSKDSEQPESCSVVIATGNSTEKILTLTLSNSRYGLTLEKVVPVPAIE